MAEPFRYVVAPNDEVHVLLRFPDGTIETVRILAGSELLLDGPPGKPPEPSPQPQVAGDSRARHFGGYARRWRIVRRAPSGPASPARPPRPGRRGLGVPGVAVL